VLVVMIELETGFAEKLCNEKWCMEDGATAVEVVCLKSFFICLF